MSLPSLTRRQRQIVEFFSEYTEGHGLSPTLEEIAQALGVNKVTIFGHIAELERKGVISRARKSVSRGLSLVPRTYREVRRQSPTAIPLLGTIAAGAPIEAFEVPEEFDLTDLLPRSADTYALRVRGDSMIEDCIRDGDIVLVDRSAQPRDGDTVVAVLPGEQATLKRYYKEGDSVRLQPANSALRPVVTREVEVRGVLLGVVRRS